ncbi:MAG: hypothetical protein ACOYLH_10675 [Flavobacteriales bacterium]
MSNKIYIGIIAVLTVLCVYLGFQIKNANEKIVYIDREKNTILDERDVLAVELEQLKMGYDTLQTDNAEMAAEIAEQRAQIESLIKKSKNKDYDISKLRAETETLRTIMKGYIHQIDSLQQVNERLYTEKEQEAMRANNAENRSKELEGDLSVKTEMLNKGSVLSTGSYSNTGINLRSSGKQVDTDKASRTEMLKSCFTVRKNPIVKPGQKNIYLRIVGPDGKVLPGKDAGTVTVDGQAQPASVVRQVDYQNEDTDVCVYYTAQGELKKGSYKIYVYEGNSLIGQSDLTLK